MYHVEVRELIQAKQAIRKAGYKQIGVCVICSTLDFRIVLHEIMSFYDSPLQRTFIILRIIDIAFCAWPLRVAPSEERSIFADGIDLI